MTVTTTDETILAVPTTDDPTPAAPVAAPPTLVEDDLLVEDVSIDGMCGVY